MSFNLTSRLSVFCAVLCAVSSAFGDTVYVKPVACGTGDGSSWANAMGSVSNALMTALKTAAPREVHMSEGIHAWLSGVAVGRDVKGMFDPDVSGARSFAIRGGYAGVSEDELPDNVAHPTYLNCDFNGDDRWVKRDLNALALNGSSTAIDCGPVIDDNGNVIIPDDATDPDALYSIDSGKASDNSIFLDLQDNNGGGTVELSDFTVLGAGSARPYRSGQNAFIAATAGYATLKNMTFIGSYLNKGNGILYVNGPKNATVMDNVKVFWTWTSQGVFAFGGSCAGAVVEGLSVKGSFFNGTASFGAVIKGNPVDNCTFRDCAFEKCFANVAQNGYPGAAGVFGAEKAPGCLLSGCVFRRICTRGNNVAACINLRTRSGNGVHDLRIEDCLFEDNIAFATLANAPVQNLGLVAVGANVCSIEGCAFKDNLLIVKPTGTSSAVYAAPVTFTSKPDAANPAEPCRTIVNCTFSGNEIEFASGSVTTATPYLSRSILVNTIYADCPLDVIVANCTFADGASALPDIRWAGLTSTYPVLVKNCLFFGDEANGYEPLAADVSNIFEIENSLMNGYDGLPAGVTGAGNLFVAIPLGDWETVTGFTAPVIRPAARFPELRTALPLDAFTSTAKGYYLADLDGTVLYQSSPSVSAGSAPSRLADAVGVARPDTSSTIGAVQSLTEEAESGATLFVDVVPASAGYVTGGDPIQVVERGASIVSLSAVSVDPARFTFQGWKLPDGTSYSTDQVLSVSTLTDDLRLTAVFSAPMVSYTFDLGIAGTFDASGTSVVQLTLNPGDPLVVPSFTIDEERVVPYGWDVTPPAVVGSANAVFTYTFLEKKFRVLRVDATLAEGGDGSSWADAMTDVQAAIDQAGAWAGEVWIKQGIHRVGQLATDRGLMMKKNVAILGGFEGVDGKYADEEAERAARDPEAFHSVLTADVGLDDFWFDGPTGANLGPVFSDDCYVEPEFDDSLGSWYGHSAGSANISRVIDNETVALDSTAILDGVTLTGGGIYNGLSALPVIRNCKCVGAACIFNANGAAIQDCEFLACQSISGGGYQTLPVVDMAGSGNRGITTSLTGCTFRFCASNGGNGIVRYSSQNGWFTMDNCVFENVVGSTTFGVYCMGSALHTEWGNASVLNCTFRKVSSRTGLAVVCLPKAIGIVSNCLFDACSVVQSNLVNSSEYPLAVAMGHQADAPKLSVFNTTFKDNYVFRDVSTNAAAKNALASVVCDNGQLVLANCTFDGNCVQSASGLDAYPARAGIVLARGKSVLTAVNCTFNGNEAADGDVCLTDRLSAASPCRLVNSIFWGGADHVLATAYGAGTPELYVWNSILNGFAPDAAFVAGAAENFTSSPELSRKWFGEAPILARRAGASSKAKRGGRNVYVDAAGVLCVPVDYAESSFVSAATCSAYTPVGELTVLPDVFGRPRAVRDVTIGAMQAIGGGMVFTIR